MAPTREELDTLFTRLHTEGVISTTQYGKAAYNLTQCERRARVWLVFTLDAKVPNDRVTATAIEEYIGQLGFTSEELCSLRPTHRARNLAA